MNTWLTGRGWPALMAVGLLALFVSANLFVQPRLAGARIDFTASRLYTLSPATRDTLSGLSEPVDLTFVYSRRVAQDYPAIRAYGARVRELLAAIEARSGGQLRVREIDPTPFSEAEDEALASGISAVSTQGSDPLYFGLIGVNTVDNQRVIAFLSPEREGTLEYDLTRMIARLDDPSPRRIGVITSLQGMRGTGKETGYSALQALAKSIDIEPIPDDFVSLPGNLDALLIAHPAAFNDWQAWQIDQFLLRKGRVAWLVDPAAKVAAVSASVFQTDQAPTRSDFGRLGNHWGVSLSGEALADAANALPVQSRGEDGRTSIVGQPLFIAAPPSNMNRTDIITSELTRSVNFGAPGALIVSEAGALDVAALIETGPAPSFIPAQQALKDAPPAEIIAGYTALSAPRMIAARLTGRFTSAFPDGPPPLPLSGDPVLDELARAAAQEAPEHIDQAQGRSAVVLVADADFLDDGFYINPNGGGAIADNAVFLQNIIDMLTGVEGMTALRARAAGLRAMTRVEAMRADAERRFFDEQARLEDQLAQTEDRLAILQAQASESGGFDGDIEAALDPAQRAELQRLRTEIVETRSGLRAIERDFRRDIDRLEARLRFVNIWGGALLVLLAGGAVFSWRRRSRQ